MGPDFHERMARFDYRMGNDATIVEGMDFE